MRKLVFPILGQKKELNDWSKLPGREGQWWPLGVEKWVDRTLSFVNVVGKKWDILTKLNIITKYYIGFGISGIACRRRNGYLSQFFSPSVFSLSFNYSLDTNVLMFQSRHCFVWWGAVHSSSTSWWLISWITHTVCTFIPLLHYSDSSLFSKLRLV